MRLMYASGAAAAASVVTETIIMEGVFTHHAACYSMMNNNSSSTCNEVRLVRTAVRRFRFYIHERCVLWQPKAEPVYVRICGGLVSTYFRLVRTALARAIASGAGGQRSMPDTAPKKKRSLLAKYFTQSTSTCSWHD